jgi:hypothetical protein
MQLYAWHSSESGTYVLRIVDISAGIRLSIMRHCERILIFGGSRSASEQVRPIIGSPFWLFSTDPVFLDTPWSRIVEPIAFPVS